MRLRSRPGWILMSHFKHILFALRDAILTCAQKLTRVSLIYRTLSVSCGHYIATQCARIIKISNCV